MIHQVESSKELNDSFIEDDDFDQPKISKKRKRGHYNCRKCGLRKKGHTCTDEGTVKFYLETTHQPSFKDPKILHLEYYALYKENMDLKDQIVSLENQISLIKSQKVEVESSIVHHISCTFNAPDQYINDSLCMTYSDHMKSELTVNPNYLPISHENKKSYGNQDADYVISEGQYWCYKNNDRVDKYVYNSSQQTYREDNQMCEYDESFA